MRTCRRLRDTSARGASESHMFAFSMLASTLYTRRVGLDAVRRIRASLAHHQDMHPLWHDTI